jgi:hypothetical protein
MEMKKNGTSPQMPPPTSTILWHMARLTAQGKEMHKVTLISSDMFCWLLADWMAAELGRRDFTTEVSKWTTGNITSTDDDEDLPF